MRQLIFLLSLVSFLPTTALSQEALCYMEWHGAIIDLSSSVCYTTEAQVTPASQITARPQVIPTNNVRFSDPQIGLSTDGKSLEVRATITNESTQAGTLPSLKFNVINQRTNRVLATEVVNIETNDGIAPGEQMSFSKVIGTNVLSDGSTIADLRVEMVGSP